MRSWKEIEKEIFGTTNQTKVQAVEQQLRDQIRAYQLAEIRKGRHITQREVAAAIGVSTARISQIEQGKIDRAAIGGLAAYVEALGGHLELVANFGDKRIVIG